MMEEQKAKLRNERLKLLEETVKRESVLRTRERKVAESEEKTWYQPLRAVPEQPRIKYKYQVQIIFFLVVCSKIRLKFFLKTTGIGHLLKIFFYFFRTRQVKKKPKT